MREFIKSMISFSWVMPLFGIKQLENAVMPTASDQPKDKAASAFDSVTQAAEKELDGVLKTTFQAADQLQRGMVDMMFNTLTMGQPGSSPATGEAPSGAGAWPSSTTQPPRQVHSGRLNTSRFIVVGEGLAAGMGDFSVSFETQTESFPAQMARQMQAQFPQPLVQGPGMGDAVGFASLPVRLPAFKQTTVLKPWPPEPVSNLSVPGFTLSDALRLRPVQPLVHRQNAKQTAANLILGILPIMNGEDGPLATQVEYAVGRCPTFTLVELGYYDVLEPAVKASPNRLPEVKSFRSDYAQLLATVRKSGSEVLVLTIPNPIDTAFFATIDVAAKIAKVEPGFLTSAYGLKADDLITVNGLYEIGFQVFSRAIQPLPEGSVVSAEIANRTSSRVLELNAELIAAANEHGAIVVDLHALFRRVKQEGIPVGSKKLTAEFLGGFYSLNGYYPGATGHAIIANEILSLLNRAYGADFPQINVQAIMSVDPVASYRPAEGPNWPSSQLPPPQPRALPEVAEAMRTEASAEKRRSTERAPAVWEPLPPEAPTGPLKLPPSLEQVLPLSKEASYFGDAIWAVNCRNGSQYGSCNDLLFSGLAMVDSHLTGYVKIKFSPPVNNVTHFEVTLGDGLTGDDGVLIAPQLFKLPVLQNRVQDIPNQVSSGDLNLETGEVSNLNVFVSFANTALLSLGRVNPKLPQQPIAFPGPYGSSWAQFEQRPDGKLDFTFHGTTFLPLGKDLGGDPVRFPLTFTGPTLQFASVPGSGTALHPHLHLSTKEPHAAGRESVPEFQFNSIQELTLFTHNSSFGDDFNLDIPELGGKATGRSHILGRTQIQFGARSGNTVPIAVFNLNPGGYMGRFAPTPVTELFPAPLPPGPVGFNESLRFPLRTYSLNDLAILDDPFDISVGAVDLKTGEIVGQLLHRGFINQDLIFALMRVAPETAKTFFLFRGPAVIQKGADGQPVFRFQGSIKIPFPLGTKFPKPDLSDAFVNRGKDATLDPFLWIHAIQDGRPSPNFVKQGGAAKVTASTGDVFSYSFKIPGDPTRHQAHFEYTNHSQGGSFRMHSLAWVGFSNSGASKSRSGEFDTVTFGGHGIWSMNGSEFPEQASVQVSTSPERPYAGIQIGGGFVSNVNTKPPNAQAALP
jgi:hypothetical protein